MQCLKARIFFSISQNYNILRIWKWPSYGGSEQIGNSHRRGFNARDSGELRGGFHGDCCRSPSRSCMPLFPDPKSAGSGFAPEICGRQAKSGSYRGWGQ